jgi:hypothetical protein
MLFVQMKSFVWSNNKKIKSKFNDKSKLYRPYAIQVHS